MTRSNEINPNIQTAENSCNRALDYPDLLHDPATSEGFVESGEFFTRLTENAQTIERCFSKDPESTDRLKLEEIEKAQAHVRASRLFQYLPEVEKQFLLKTTQEQIHASMTNSIPSFGYITSARSFGHMQSRRRNFSFFVPWVRSHPIRISTAILMI